MNEHQKLKTEATAAARLAKKHGLTQREIALQLGASQSQVSRVLAGGACRRSRLFDEVCKYVNSVSPTSRPISPNTSSELMTALAEVWDGSHQHAKALALVIRSLGVLSDSVKETARRTNRAE